MKPDHIIIHHSLTRDSGTVSWSAIRRYHTDTLGWSDIGYHFGIEKVGDQYEILIGRLLNEVGAHCKELHMNHRSIGICVVGNFERDRVPIEQWGKTVRLVQALCETLGIPPSRVHGHRDFAPKSCPGRFFDMGLFRSLIKI